MSRSYLPLISLLLNHLSLHLSRTKCLVLFVLSMIESHTVNLSVLCTHIPSKSTTQSIYRRLQRFIKEVSLPQDRLACLLSTLSGLSNTAEWTLCMDRTNWMFGKKHINILYLAVSFKGIAIPLFWTFLSNQKRGNSTAEHRIGLLEQFINTFGKERIYALTADREFIGNKWLSYLDDNNIPYVIRLKENSQYITNSKEKLTRISNLINNLKPGTSEYLGSRQIGINKKISKRCVTIARGMNKETIALVHSETITDPIQTYVQRWEIETMFRGFKSSGFDSEKTHITDDDRINTLMQVMGIAFCLAYKMGQIVENKKPPQIKKHGRKHKSILRAGIDQISYIITNIRNMYQQSKY